MDYDKKDLIGQEDATFRSPKTYFQLIQKVGSSGIYQRNLFLIFFLNWFISSLLLMGTSFLFLNPKMNCQSAGISEGNCNSFVCSLPQNKRTKFYQEKQVNSLATQFGPFYCQKIFLLNALRMSLYAGVLIGFLGVPFVSDNYGKKTAIVMGWALTLLGIIILSASVNIWMASLGLFIAGIGCQSGIRISMIVFAQVVQDVLRQKYSTALEISFGVGQIFIGLIYYFMEDWRWITIIFCFVPAVIQLFLLIFYLEQTPKFLIKKDKMEAIKALNRIGKINKGMDDLISQIDINEVIKNQVKTPNIRTPLDLCRYKSQRKNFIFMSLIFFSIAFLYYGPLIIIANLGMNVFVAQIVLGISQTVAYPVCLIFVQRTLRKASGYVLFSISMILFLILIFVEPSSTCNGCFQGILQLILVFAAKFCICYYFAILFLFVTEIFPLPLRGTGFGMVSACGAVSSMSGQFILTTLQDQNFNPMILFAILCAVIIFSIYFLPQTLGKKLSQNIPQEEEKQRQQKQYQNTKYEQNTNTNKNVSRSYEII